MYFVENKSMFVDERGVVEELGGKVFENLEKHLPISGTEISAERLTAREK